MTDRTCRSQDLAMKGRDWLMTQDWSDAEIELALETATR